MHVYTMKKNAVRAAKKAGLDSSAVREGQGGFYVEGLPEPAAKTDEELHPKAAARRAHSNKSAKREKSKTELIQRAKADYPREGSKNAKLLNMLTRDGGATAAQLETALGWKPATVRCALQRVTRAYGLTWRHVKGEDGAKSRWEASKAA